MGALEGCVDGWVVGCIEGRLVGAKVLFIVGSAVGTEEGSDDVGKVVGIEDGLALG